jgi:HEAT repeat protein
MANTPPPAHRWQRERPVPDVRKPPEGEGNGGTYAVVLVLGGLGVALFVVLLACGGLFFWVTRSAGKKADELIDNVKKNQPPFNPPARFNAPPGFPFGPPTPPINNVADALTELRSGDANRQAAAAQWLQQRPVDAARRQEVAKALEPLLDDRNGGTRVAGVRALLVWCGPENVPALVRLLESDPAGFEGDECRKKAIDALVKLKDPRGAPAIARNWKNPFEREWTRRSLEALGPGAEDAVRPYLEDRDWGVRVEACRTLKRIGTRKSLPALEETLANTRAMYGGYRDVADAAREAIHAIKARP